MQENHEGFSLGSSVPKKHWNRKFQNHNNIFFLTDIRASQILSTNTGATLQETRLRKYYDVLPRESALIAKEKHHACFIFVEAGIRNDDKMRTLPRWAW